MKRNNDLGFLMPILDNNQSCNLACNTISKLILTRPKKQICIFNSYSEKIQTYNIPILHINQAKFFRGDMVVFDLYCLELCGSFSLLENVYYYAQNIPWSNNQSLYRQWKKLFDKNNVKIIAANKYINDMYNIAWSNSIGISETFDYETINNLL